MSKTQPRSYECTIDPQLFETIKLLRRFTDAKEVTEQTGFSRPTVDKALNFGHIRDASLEAFIIEFYKQRAAYQAKAVRDILTTLKQK